MNQIPHSELIINPNGSIFHLHLKPENIADTVLLVGDPGRVKTVSDNFESVEFTVQNREFVTHTGYFNKKRISVVSTGIGTDNIDIVVNELDALVNIDLEKRVIKDKHTSLNLVRIGTSGGLQEEVPVDSFLFSRMACGFDGLLNFYADRNKVCDLPMEDAFKKHVGWNSLLTSPYFVESSEHLFNKISEGMYSGVTISSPGFYGPQGRVLRLPIVEPEINDKVTSFDFKGRKITNYEMECSAIYGLSKLLGHNAATCCVIIANRIKKEYSKDYKPPMKNLIRLVLERLTS